ncbi:MAG: ATP-binding cassette domain-containing protein [Magnetococcales bacterium]|nr:ATP-binding cassette domain-containing protein [Magnetococcales bacterium]
MEYNKLFPILDRAARLNGQSVVRSRTDDLARLIDQEKSSGARLFIAAWAVAGLHGKPVRLSKPKPSHLPFVVWQSDLGYLLVGAQNANGSWKALDCSGHPHLLENIKRAECIALPEKKRASTAPKAGELIHRAIGKRKGLFVELVLATLLIHVINLAVSLYSMQIYDRVIPHQGFNTLMVLTVGVFGTILLDWLLKHVRDTIMEKTCLRIDNELSEWFFNRALGIRMESRPNAVGTLAAQIKGFEMVREVMTSASIFVMADIPFAILFIGVIGLIGGIWMASIPMIVIPVALVSGLLLQSKVVKNARDNINKNYVRSGLLVESIDGVESLKANGAEWQFQARWSQLVSAISESGYQVKHISRFTQHVAQTLQQLSYVSMVAAGAILVTQNLMTMGGLIACTIISGRALAPVMQMPGIMVKWAQARVAIEGLNKIIDLPSELDEQGDTLVPTGLQGDIKFEEVTFSYNLLAEQSILQIPKLILPRGECIGILGGIGSGKSTLLKLASGLYRPREGRLFLGGIDMALISPIVLREMIGYLPQDIRLFSGTLRENLLQGLPDPGDEVLLDACRQTGLITMIGGQARGFALTITEGGRGVSGGQRQLIGLTRLLLAKPKIWILDEPTASMDGETERGIVRLLADIIAKRETTVLVATHKNALLPICDRLIITAAGRIAIEGPRQAVLARLSDGKAT